MKSYFLLAVLGVVTNAHALPLDFGNVAPRDDNFVLSVNGTVIGTPGYLEFGNADVASASITVEARSARTGEIVANETFVLAPEPGITPILLLQGNGEAEPYDLHLYQNVFAEYARYPGDATDAVYLALHHVALLPQVAPGEAVQTGNSHWCSGQNPGGFYHGGTLGSVEWYYGAMNGSVTPVSYDYAQKECGMIIQGSFGSLRVAVPYDVERGTRIFFAGDGAKFPYSLTAVREGAEVLMSSGGLQPEPGPVFESEHVWYDLRRPAQAVALYPIAGTDVLAGYWFTHRENGESMWYFLDGMQAGTAQYELELYRATGTRAVPAQAAGSAQLVYADCNNAEIRMVGDDVGLQTLRLRRSKPVIDCELPGN